MGAVRSRLRRREKIKAKEEEVEKVDQKWGPFFLENKSDIDSDEIEPSRKESESTQDEQTTTNFEGFMEKAR